MTIASIKATYEASGDAPAAIEAYTCLIDNTSDPATLEAAHIERGLLHWRMGHRADTINDYNAALRINPESKAGELRASVYSILDFYNKDLYNP